MTPTDKIIAAALELGEMAGLSKDQAIAFLVKDMEEKQNRYNWRKKISSISMQNNGKRCEYTRDLFDEIKGESEGDAGGGSRLRVSARAASDSENIG